MSTIIRDSGKPYATITDPAQNLWDVINNIQMLTGTNVGRYPGENICFNSSTAASNAFVQKASPSNDGTAFLFVAHMFNNSFGTNAGNFFWTLYDGVNAQCSIVWNASNGSISCYTGSTAGTLITTFVSAFSQQQWNGWNVKVVVHPSAGEIHIRRNGGSSDTFVITGVNTRGGSTNNYANQHQVGSTSPLVANVWRWQDVWLYNNNNASFPFDFLANDVRTYWQAPNGASQTQFTAVGPLTNTINSTATAVTDSANTAYAYPWTPNNNGQVATIALNYNAAATGSVIVGLYDNTGPGGGPGNLLATSNTVVNPVLGVNTFTFPSPPTVSNKSSYWVALLGNVASQLKTNSSASPMYSAPQTFGSGFANPAGMTSGSAINPWLQMTYTLANFACVSDITEDGPATTVQSSTVGNEDRYTVPALPTTPSIIYGAQVRGFMQKSDSGARSGAMTITSSGVNVVGPAVGLSTTFENVVMQQDTDPNTGVAWTPLGIAAALPGVKCTA